MIAEISLQDIIQNIDFITRLSKQSMPAKTAYKIGKILKRITEEYNDYNTIRQEFVRKYAKKDDQGQIIVQDNNIQMDEQYYQEFLMQYSDLVNTKVKFDILPLKIDELNMDFTPGEMAFLENFIEE